MSDFQDALARSNFLVQHEMETLLYSPLSEQLTAAMRYSVAGGKGLRGFLVMESSRLHGVSEGRSLRAALGVECLHAYSLVHDDLPCMDDDDLRRGQPTVHVKWDQATAVLAGDALQADAFKFVSETGGSVQVLRRLIATFSFAAGARGMVGGQAADIAAEMSGGRLTLDEITSLQNAKTGALLTWSCIAGPILAEADEKSMKTYGDALGLAFQIADDILDVEGDAAEVGKATQKDEAAGKATFVSLLGLDEAKRRAQALVDEACEALSPYGNDAQTLREAAQFVVSRSK